LPRSDGPEHAMRRYRTYDTSALPMRSKNRVLRQRPEDRRLGRERGQHSRGIARAKSGSFFQQQPTQRGRLIPRHAGRLVPPAPERPSNLAAAAWPAGSRGTGLAISSEGRTEGRGAGIGRPQGRSGVPDIRRGPPRKPEQHCSEHPCGRVTQATASTWVGMPTRRTRATAALHQTAARVMRCQSQKRQHGNCPRARAPVGCGGNRTPRRRRTVCASSWKRQPGQRVPVPPHRTR